MRPKIPPQVPASLGRSAACYKLLRSALLYEIEMRLHGSSVLTSGSFGQYDSYRAPEILFGVQRSRSAPDMYLIQEFHLHLP